MKVETNQQNQQKNNELAPLKKPGDIWQWAKNNMPALQEQSAKFIDKPATKRLIEKNIRYVAGLRDKAWEKVWNSPHGQESISEALGESLYYGASLPEMGSILPFGDKAEFVPAIEAFIFALTTGQNAPFTEINIDPVYENDKPSIRRSEGQFIFDLEMGVPRGRIVGVAVSAVRSSDKKIIGEFFDVERLLDKAAQNSSSYKNFLSAKQAWQNQKIEGKLLKDKYGLEYMDKEIEYMKDGQKKTFNKKIYAQDIVNPYEGPNRPEMLQKAAGKTFFKKFMRTRNAFAMAAEWSESDEEQTVDSVLENAKQVFEEPNRPEQPRQTKQDTSDNNPDNQSQAQTKGGDNGQQVFVD